jgi:transposase
MSWAARSKPSPGCAAACGATPAGLLRIDHAAIRCEQHLAAKWLLRSSDTTLTPVDLAAAYKQLVAVEGSWRDMKDALGLRPAFHHREDRISAHVQLRWLALLLIRVVETAVGRHLAHHPPRPDLAQISAPVGPGGSP